MATVQSAMTIEEIIKHIQDNEYFDAYPIHTKIVVDGVKYRIRTPSFSPGQRDGRVIFDDWIKVGDKILAYGSTKREPLFEYDIPKIRTVTKTGSECIIYVDDRHGHLEYILPRDLLAIVID